MPIEVIPSMDFKDGQAVRLEQGDFGRLQSFSVDPVERAKMWERLGATRYHMVNLGGAQGGADTDRNFGLIEDVLMALRIDCQVGGGIRGPKIIERLLGVREGIQLILGTALFTDVEKVGEWLREFGPEKFIGDVGLYGDRVLIDGWQGDSGLSFDEALSRVRDLGLQRMGFRRLVVTDKTRDGVGTGPNLDAVRYAASKGVEVVISGGVRDQRHIDEIAGLKDDPSVVGLILGRRLYEADGPDFFKNAFQTLQQ